MPRLHAVATGDVVASTELSSSERQRLPRQLREAHALVQDHATESLPHRLAITRGDGWQCYIKKPIQALAHVLRFWTLLCANSLRSRFALAIDTIDFISEGGLNESDGLAFRRSGRGLHALNDEQWASCMLPEATSSAHQLAADGIFELIDHLLHEWTDAQAQATAGMLGSIGTDHSVTQKAIAEKWDPEPITRQSVNRHLQRAHWARLKRSIGYFKKLTGDITTENGDSVAA